MTKFSALSRVDVHGSQGTRAAELSVGKDFAKSHKIMYSTEHSCELTANVCPRLAASEILSIGDLTTNNEKVFLKHGINNQIPVIGPDGSQLVGCVVSNFAFVPILNF